LVLLGRQWLPDGCGQAHLPQRRSDDRWGDTIINDVSTSASGKTLDYSSNLTKNLNFWKEINAKSKPDYPDAFFVGENFDGHAYHVAPFYEGFDSLFDFYSYFNVTSAAAHALNSSVGKGDPSL
jgi:hypothetical protein